MPKRWVCGVLVFLLWICPTTAEVLPARVLLKEPFERGLIPFLSWPLGHSNAEASSLRQRLLDGEQDLLHQIATFQPLGPSAALNEAEFLKSLFREALTGFAAVQSRPVDENRFEWQLPLSFQFIVELKVNSLRVITAYLEIQKSISSPLARRYFLSEPFFSELLRSSMFVPRNESAAVHSVLFESLGVAFKRAFRAWIALNISASPAFFFSGLELSPQFVAFLEQEHPSFILGLTRPPGVSRAVPACGTDIVSLPFSRH